MRRTVHRVDADELVTELGDSPSTVAGGMIHSCVAEASGSVDLEVAAPLVSPADCRANFAPLAFRVLQPGTRVDVAMSIDTADSAAPWWTFSKPEGRRWAQVGPHDVAAGYHSGVVRAASRRADSTSDGSGGTRR
jgi:hypothetical protein